MNFLQFNKMNGAVYALKCTPVTQTHSEVNAFVTTNYGLDKSVEQK